MTEFYSLSIALLAGALLFLVVPLWRYKPVKRSPDEEVRRQKNIEVYQQSLAELESDRADGLVSDGDFERLQTELQRSFLRDMEEEDKKNQGAITGNGKLIPLLSILFIPVFSYLFYSHVGASRDLVLPTIMEELTVAESPEAQLAALESLADFLQARFERYSDDIQNGYMLGTLYTELERFDEAVDTFSRLAGQMEDSPDRATVLGQLAQAMYLSAGSRMSPALQSVIDEGMALNPNEYALLSIMAIEAFISEQYSQAIAYWQRQLRQLDSGSQEAAVLRERIARVETLLPEGASLATNDDAIGNASVTLVIDVDDSVLSQVDDSMRLFVYARSPEFPMPLAAVNLDQPEFPFEITLDDSNAMAPVARLSSAQQVYVGARLSQSGIANAQSGDLEGESGTFVLAEQDGKINLVISDIVP